MSAHTIGTVDDFPENEGVNIKVEGFDIAVFNLDSTLYAIADRCTHKNAPLHEAGSERYNSEHCRGSIRGEINAEDCSIRCPWHRLKWDLKSGENPATGAVLPTFDVAVDGDEVRLSFG